MKLTNNRSSGVISESACIEENHKEVKKENNITKNKGNYQMKTKLRASLSPDRSS